MKFISLLLFPIIAIAGLENTTQLIQTSPGIWRVDCLNSTGETRSTEDIKNNNICLVKETKSHCVENSIKTLPSREYDDQNELDELISICNLGSQYTHICMQEVIPRFKQSTFDERTKVIELIKVCSPSFNGVKEYLQTIFEYTAFNDSNSVNKLELIKTISQSLAPSIPCLKSATKHLKDSEFDQAQELNELLNVCSQAQLEIERCIAKRKSKLKNELLYDQRSEIIPIINECNQL